MTRTSTRMVSLPPTRSKACSSRARSTLAWVLRLMSPISSRKSVPPSASSNLPRRRATAPVKAPRSWPNSSDSISSSGIAAQLTSTKGPSRARGQRVDGAGHQLLAGAVLAVDEHAAARGRRDRDLLAQLLDERGSGRRSPGRARAGLAQVAVLPLEPGVVEGAARDEQGLLERERLLDEVVGAELGRLDRGLDGAVAGDHDHRGLRAHALDLGQGLEAVDAGHPDVEEDEVGRLLLQPGDRLLARAHRGDSIALVLEHAPQSRLDRPLVVHDQDVLAGHRSLGLRPAPARPPGARRAAR